MAFHGAYEHHEKKAIHGKLIRSDTVSEHNLSVATNHSLLATKLMAPVINPQHNPTYAILGNGCTRSMGSRRAIQRFTQAIETIQSTRDNPSSSIVTSPPRPALSPAPHHGPGSLISRFGPQRGFVLQSFQQPPLKAIHHPQSSLT